ncbi:hypothetical protein EPA93_09215 [Ktedonosporobacter rubrisoli]|uniref:Uncharacterized protein n=1 Tax=Ktedonosporobacter rubrisoli TaxID=2509675 RepID=A0A4P6JLS3_KTERU|nr:hypothetical protein [Ktedonosporobacter rubrisoli]QBD76178.1 hypothetical protein EPA93_09215 [Ktedonosporobacter rubrisoli]
MSGFLNNDGSGLVGGLLPSQQGQALQLDASGNLKVTGGGAPGSDNLPSGQVMGAGVLLWNGTGWNRMRDAPSAGDGINVGIGSASSYLWNGTNHDRQQGKFGVADVSNGGRATIAIAAGMATDTVVKAAAGRLCRVLVTAAGTALLIIYDNASGHTGTIIGILPANPAVGAVFDFQLPAINGITVAGNASNPGITVSYY